MRKATKLGPCAPRMKHRFYKKDEAPAGYYVELEHYNMKKCINCNGVFFMTIPFDDRTVNRTPSVQQIHTIKSRLDD